MASVNAFQRVYNRDTPDAVTVRLYKFHDEIFGQVSWPQKHPTYGESPAMGELLTAPEAFIEARDVQRQRRLQLIVVYLDEGVVWSDDWGTLNL
jgi:hypothetical protein